MFLIISGWGTIQSRAGEAIQFAPGPSQNQNKAAGVELKTPLSKEKTSSPVRQSGLANMNTVESPLASNPNPPPRSRRDEKKAMNADTEKKNWIILDRGELQKKDDEGTELGLRKDSIEKDKTVGELWFSPSRDDRSKAPGTSRFSGAAGAKPSAGAPNARSQEDRPVDEEASPAAKEAQGQKQEITATIKDTKDAETRSLTTVQDQKDGALKDLFHSTPAPSEARRDELGSRANGASGNSPGSLKSFGLGRDTSTPLLAPPSLLEGSRRSSLISAPPAGEGLSSGARGFGGTGLGGAGSPLGSSFQSPFGSSSSGSGFNNQRPEFAPGSSRSTFDNSIRR
jgi:hypothetical protein